MQHSKRATNARQICKVCISQRVFNSEAVETWVKGWLLEHDVDAVEDANSSAAIFRQVTRRLHTLHPRRGIGGRVELWPNT